MGVQEGEKVHHAGQMAEERVVSGNGFGVVLESEDGSELIGSAEDGILEANVAVKSFEVLA